MEEMGRRARERDRDAAVALVETACAEGRIVGADRDRRVEQLREARTMGDIQLLVRDLQLQQEVPRPAYPVPVPRQVPGRPTSLPLPSRSLGLFVLLPLVVVFFVVTAVGGLLFLGVVGAARQQESREVPAPADVHSARGLADLVAALEDETGSSRVFDAVLYPGYAVLSVPTGSGREARSYYWNGSLRAQDHRSLAVHPSFDLGAVDARVVLRAMRRAQRLVPGSTPSYALLRADGSGYTIAGYASAGSGASGHVTLSADGTVVAEYPPPAP